MTVKENGVTISVLLIPICFLEVLHMMVLIYDEGGSCKDAASNKTEKIF